MTRTARARKRAIRLPSGPQIVRLEPSYDVRLPEGRVRIELEVSSWGWLIVAGGVYFFKQRETFRFRVPLGRTLRAIAFNPFGGTRRSVVAAATVDEHYDSPPVPKITEGALAARLIARGGGKPGSLAPVLCVTPEAVVPRFRVQPGLRTVQVRVAGKVPVPRVSVPGARATVTVPWLARGKLCAVQSARVREKMSEEGSSS